MLTSNVPLHVEDQKEMLGSLESCRGRYQPTRLGESEMRKQSADLVVWSRFFPFGFHFHKIFLVLVL